jgi:hypothetical protein
MLSESEEDIGTVLIIAGLYGEYDDAKPLPSA